jgi:hypothetical protein
VDHRNALRGRELVHLGHIRIADLAERRRRRDREAALPVQVLTNPSDRLQLGHVGLQEDPVDRTAGEPDVVSQ